jgi:hypothetical protein
MSTKASSLDEVLGEIRGADLAARLFGLSGWRAPLHVSRLLAAENSNVRHQEHVAIDRFTGGAARNAKFDADLAGATTLRGALTVDLTRLREVDAELQSLGLLALVLRDLVEGDVAIGAGSAKGQGMCSATIAIAGTPDWRAHPAIAGGLAAFQKQAREVSR